ncbi:MAG: UDP-N-acetylenolpyruvoylglucosamine reductase [Parcubacteria bacterium C7867-008]|nr:MAG: UDP-N-acetylenolpyruvoylglucosamine reductase [Parcubacteria bacterium C7867-008]
MMRENVPLSTLTTFRIGGPARYVAQGNSVASVKAAFAHARECRLPLYPIGQGSNILASDASIAAVLLLMQNNSIAFSDTSEGVEVCADAGTSWDALVRACADKGLWGIENLAGIPGTVGAAPVQNIGAYGSELADSFSWLECYDPDTETIQRLTGAECAFGYRDSTFKQNPGRIIMRVALTVTRSGSPRTQYADLSRLIDAGEVLDTPHAIGEAVRRVRSAKFPDLTEYGTAGSFFKNPTIVLDQYTQLQQQYPELPGFATSTGIKIPLAWILDHVLDLRGFRMGHAYLFQNQPLVLVADAGATCVDVDALANNVAEKIFNATGIQIEREVRSLS